MAGIALTRSERLAVVGVGPGNTHDDGRVGTIGQAMDLRAGLAAINRVRPGQYAPFWP